MPLAMQCCTYNSPYLYKLLFRICRASQWQTVWHFCHLTTIFVIQRLQNGPRSERFFLFNIKGLSHPNLYDHLRAGFEVTSNELNQTTLTACNVDTNVIVFLIWCSFVDIQLLMANEENYKACIYTCICVWHITFRNSCETLQRTASFMKCEK